MADNVKLYAETEYSAATSTDQGLRILAYIVENRKQVLRSLCSEIEFRVGKDTHETQIDTMKKLMFELRTSV